MNRRKMLTRIVTGFSTVATGALAYPFIRSWFPARALDMSLDVPLHDLRPGRPELVRWSGRNVFVIKRTERSQQQTLASGSSRLDAGSANSRQPKFATGDLRSREPGIFVAFTNCTHLGCEVEARFDMADGDLVGFSCPCHRSEFDGAGRVSKDAVAKYNLEIPYYEHLTADIIRFRMVES